MSMKDKLGNTLPASVNKINNLLIREFVTSELSSGKRIFVILGTTVTGKTGLALEIAPLLGCEILSADSRLVYKQTNIGTAKPTPAELSAVKHHLIDMVPPSSQFTLADYLEVARPIFDKSINDKSFLIIAGGTGLYIDALTMGFSLPKGSVSPELKKELENTTLEDLLIQLDHLDPEEGSRVDRKNKRRVERSLGYLLSNQSTIGKQGTSHGLHPLVSYIGLQCNLEELYRRIDTRTSKMLSEGLAEEADSLIKQYGESAPGLNSIGYKELVPFLSGEISMREAKQQIIIHTRQYAKRQRTWFRRNKNIRWFDYP
jgi:tRNA dimethylallyltransferase